MDYRLAIALLKDLRRALILWLLIYRSLGPLKCCEVWIMSEMIFTSHVTQGRPMLYHRLKRDTIMHYCGFTHIYHMTTVVTIYLSVVNGTCKALKALHYWTIGSSPDSLLGCLVRDYYDNAIVLIIV